METSRLPNISEYFSKIITYKARRLVGQYGFTRSDREDVEQELRLHLIEHAAQIDPSGADKTLVSRILERRVVSILRQRFALCRDHRRSVSLDAVLEGDGRDGIELNDGRHSESVSYTDLEMDLGEAFESLDADGICTCELLKHHSIAETARRLGMTRGKTRAHVAEIRALLTGAGLEVYVDD